MKRLAIILAAVCALAAPAAAMDVPALEGWEATADQRSFGPDSLWVYINGAADQFLSHGFRELRCRDLQHGEVAATVSFYDMGNPLNAFGIYGVEAASGGDAVDAGARAVMSPPYQALLLKGRYYVKVESFGGGLTGELAASMLGEIAGAIEGDDALPVELDFLPAEGRVAGTEEYTGEAFLGMGALTRCLHAQYTDAAGNAYTTFVVLPGAGEDAAAVWARLGETWVKVEVDGNELLIKEIPYRGAVGIRFVGGAVTGVAGVEKMEDLVRLLEGLDD